MKTKLKDKKIMIVVEVNGYDENGFQVSGYMPIDNLGKKWAYYKQLSASLFFASNQTNVKEDCFFRVNYHSYLKPNKAEKLHIIYNGLLYQVTRIDDYEGYKGDISLYASFESAKEIELLPFDENNLP